MSPAAGPWHARVGAGERVRRPLPDVAGHVEQPVAVGRERADRRRAAIAAPRELADPAVGRCGSSSSPHANAAPSSPPRAAYSHSASVGSAAPAHAAYASRVLGRDVRDRVARARVGVAARAPPGAASTRRGRTPTSACSRRAGPARASAGRRASPGRAAPGRRPGRRRPPARAPPWSRARSRARSAGSSRPSPAWCRSRSPRPPPRAPAAPPGRSARRPSGTRRPRSTSSPSRGGASTGAVTRHRHAAGAATSARGTSSTGQRAPRSIRRAAPPGSTTPGGP